MLSKGGACMDSLDEIPDFRLRRRVLGCETAVRSGLRNGRACMYDVVFFIYFLSLSICGGASWDVD